MTLSDLIDSVATKENAIAYKATDEKFTFCIDLLGISATRPYANDAVNTLEDKFDEINGDIL